MHKSNDFQKNVTKKYLKFWFHKEKASGYEIKDVIYNSDEILSITLIHKINQSCPIEPISNTRLHNNEAVRCVMHPFLLNRKHFFTFESIQKSTVDK